MRRMHIISLVLFFLVTLPATICHARPVIADLYVREIQIDSSFTGTDILLFGARNDPGDIIVVVRGPEKSYIVRKKERTMGIWANRKSVEISDVNGFYAIAASRPLEDIQNDYLLNELHIGTGESILPKDIKHTGHFEEFRQAFLEKKQHDKLYLAHMSDVSLIDDTLFRTSIRFPDNIMRGVYTAEIYLFSDGLLSGVQTTPIIVSKKGFDAFMYDFAHNYPVLYGLAAISIALFAGWFAGLVFRRV